MGHLPPIAPTIIVRNKRGLSPIIVMSPIIVTASAATRKKPAYAGFCFVVSCCNRCNAKWSLAIGWPCVLLGAYMAYTAINVIDHSLAGVVLITRPAPMEPRVLLHVVAVFALIP